MISHIGVRAHDYPRQSPDALCAQIAGDGWQCVQLALPKSIPGVNSAADITPQVLRAVRAALDESKLSVGVLGAYVELGAADEAVRTAAVQAFCTQLHAAKALGAGCIASETTHVAAQPAGTTPKDAQRALRRSLETILPQAQALGVTVALEPVRVHTLDSAQAARRLLDDMRCANLRLVLDPGNLVPPTLLAQAEDVRQCALWDETVALLGTDLVALHCKGVRRTARPDEVQPCALEESELQLAAALRAVHALPHALPALREEAVPARARQDIALLRALY